MYCIVSSLSVQYKNGITYITVENHCPMKNTNLSTEDQSVRPVQTWVISADELNHAHQSM